MNKYIEKIKTSKHFVKYTDPVSGVESYIFKNDKVKHTQSFYFSNSSASADGRYIWMYCAFPPAGSAAFGRSLGVVDLELDTFTHFPDSIFFDASPVIDEESGCAYWFNHSGLYRRSPDPNAELERLAKTPDFLLGRGVLLKLATHMTFSSDGKKLCFDAHVGDKFVFGDVEIATGKFTRWCEFDYGRNHAQFNPKKPDILLLAEDDWTEVATGTVHRIRYDENGKLARMYTMKKGEEPQYIPPLYTEARHEWWAPDGEGVYYVDWDYGTIKYDLNDGKYTVINPRGTWHAHCDKTESYFVADENEIDGTKWYRGCKSRIHFFNKKTGKYADIVTENPALYEREEPCTYHIDPHPQFAASDSLVLSTSTVTGRVSMTVTDTQQLINKTEK